jgi:ribosomal protein S18 acetylase RimI-like enzyme
VDVRPVRDEEAGAVLDLWEAAGLAHDRATQSPRLAGHRRADPELVLVSVDDSGAVVGTVTGAFDGARGWVYRLAVRPECRRAGVATALVEEVERRLSERGALAICLLVHGANDAGIAFWAAAGYDVLPDVVYVKKTLRGG